MTYQILTPDQSVADCPARPKRVYAVYQDKRGFVLRDLGAGRDIAVGDTFAKMFTAAANEFGGVP